jgi:ATP phosphoribosyltransferase regulatory subunit
MTNKNTKKLLPQGFYDELFPESENRLYLNNQVLRALSSFGYRYVEPAMMEFEEYLDRKSLSKNYKVTDTLSSRMMTIRGDITPQISRIVADNYFERNFSENPLRLSYSGQVFKKKGKGRYSERQIRQIGYELVSDDNIYRDVEIIYVSCEILENAGLNSQGYSFDFNIPNLLPDYLNEKRIAKADQEKIRDAINFKNYPKLDEFDNISELKEIIEQCDEADDLSSAIKAIEFTIGKLGDKDDLLRTKEIFTVLSEEISDLRLSLNLFENMGFSYHQGLCYCIISSDNFEEIARGGRYQIKSEAKNIYAIGLTFNLNSLSRACPDKEKQEKQKTIKYQEGFAKSREIRKSGTETIYY